MFKKFFFVCLLLFGCIGVVFWKPIFAKMIQVCANAYCKKQFSSELQTADIYQRGNYWVFKSPRLINDGAELIADQVLLAFKIEPFKRNVFVELKVVNSRIDIRKNVSDLKKTILKLLSKSIPYWLLKVRSALIIEAGILSWHDEEEQITREAGFELEGVSEKNRIQANLALFLDNGQRKSNVFTMKINKEKRTPLHTTLSCTSVECCKIVPIFRAMGHSLYGWQLFEGTIDGDFHTLHPENDHPIAWGEADINDFSMVNPFLEMTAKLERAKLDLEANIGDSDIPRIVGIISLQKGVRIQKAANGVPDWSFEQVEGEVILSHDEGAHIDFAGKCRHGPNECRLQVHGGAHVLNDTEAGVELFCRLCNSEDKDASIHLLFRQLDHLTNKANVKLSNFGNKELKLIQSMLSPYVADVNRFDMEKGKLFASATIGMEKYCIKEVCFDEIYGKGVSFNFPELTLDIDDVSGRCLIDFSDPTPLQTTDADFHVYGGKIHLAQQGLNTLTFTDISTHLSIKNGVLEETEVKGSFAGLNGSIAVNWESADEFLTIQFSGPAPNLTSFFPDTVASRFGKGFSNDMVVIKGSMIKCQKKGFRFEGTATLADGKESKDRLTFGFDLEKGSKKQWNSEKIDALPLFYWQKIETQMLRKVLPPLTSALILLKSKWSSAPFGIFEADLQNGWFEAKELSLPKYFAPFLFPNHEMNIEGSVNVKGAFDHQAVQMSYELRDLVLENDYFKLDKENGAPNARAVHYFNYKNGKHCGSLPLSGASFKEKLSGLLFENIDSTMIFAENRIHLPNLSTCCKGVEFLGRIDVDLTIEKHCLIAVNIQDVKGNISQATKIFQCFPQTYLGEIPIQGDISLLQDGAQLKFDFGSKSIHFDATVKGLVENITFPLGSRSEIAEGRFQFDYKHQNRAFDISNIHGKILPDKNQEHHFVISGEYIRIFDYVERLAEFDLRLTDQNKEMLRIVGKTTAEDRGKDKKATLLHIDHQLTHLDNIYPTRFSLLIDECYNIETFTLGANLKLKALLKNLRLLCDIELFPFSSMVFKGLRQISSLEGNLVAEIRYSKEQDKFEYQFGADNITINRCSFETFALAGRKHGSIWWIDSFLLDQLNLSASLIEKKQGWSCLDAVLQWDGVGFARIDTGFFEPKKKLTAHICNLEVDINAMTHPPTPLQSFFQTCRPHGKLTATGEVQCALCPDSPHWRLEAIVDASFYSWNIKGLHFQDAHNVSCHFVSDRGITLRNFSGNIQEPKSKTTRGNISFERAFYDFASGETVFDSLKFHVPAHQLPWFSDTILKSFPGLIDPTAAKVLRNCKLQGSLDAALHYEYNPPYTALRIQLEDGKYFFYNSEHTLRDFVMAFDPFEFKVVSQYTIGGDRIWLYATSTSPNLSSGELVLTDLSPHEGPAKSATEALFISWENDVKHGLSIKRAEGSLKGIQFDMRKDPAEELSEDAIHLLGHVDVDMQRAKSLFPDELSEKVLDWDIRSGYRLQGKWHLRKGTEADYSKNVHFRGTLEGKNFIVKGYQFDSLFANLEYTPHSVQIKDLTLTDFAGAIRSDQLDLVKGGDENWYFSLPSLRIEKFRPSMLRAANQARPRFCKPLIIQSLLLQGCQGKLSDLSSIIGKGQLHFTNRSKRILQNTIFHIPADIVSRIGLDLSVLTPVVGSIDYMISEGRIRLARAKDVWSEGKLSKFYLSSHFPSTIDFEGNLDIQVRMKQNNLIFKLTELLTFDIKGHLFRPIYSIHQNREETSRR